jgi:hypothetical protein
MAENLSVQGKLNDDIKTSETLVYPRLMHKLDNWSKHSIIILDKIFEHYYMVKLP